MKTASDMRERVREVEVERVLSIIEDAASEGEPVAHVSAEALKPHVRTKLEELGYNIGEPYTIEEDREFYPVSFEDEAVEIEYDEQT